MSPIATAQYRVSKIEEPFRRYTFDASAISARTDTPDLMGLFTELVEEAEGYRALNAENEAVHADLAEASFRSLPVD